MVDAALHKEYPESFLRAVRKESPMRSSTLPSMPTTDLADPIMFSDPFPRYAELRRTAPVSRVESHQVTRIRGYMLTRYDDVVTLHSDPRFSNDLAKNGRMGFVRFMPRMFRLLTDTMVFKDDPEHKRLRGLVGRAFTPKLIQQMSADIDRIVATLLDQIGERSAKGEAIDLVEEFAVQLPLAVIADMLGVDERDRDAFHAATKKFTDGSSGSTTAMLKGLPAGQRMMKLFERIAEQRRTEPDDRLISALVQANDEDDRFSDHELLAMIFLLLLAGHDTTANLIGSGTLALLEHPDQLARLRDDPALIDSAVEELLRFTTPVPCGTARHALEDVEISGVTIPKGSALLGMIISANRDESVFEEPDVLDLGRDPNRHITFAFGPHYCLGHQLARTEARAALGALVQRFDRIELAVPRNELRYKPTQSLRGLRSLPLRLS